MMTVMTSPLARLERALTRLVEGGLGRLMRPQVQPVELARRLDAAMEEGAMAGVRGPIAPNYYILSLSPDDFARFAGVTSSLQRDFERHLAESCVRLRLRCLDPFLVELQADTALTRGQVKVQAAYLGRGERRSAEGASAPPSAVPDSERTAVMPAILGVKTALPSLLEVLGADKKVTRVQALMADGLDIGRADSNGLVLADSSVSRQHARVRREGSGYVVEDLDSTNGVFLNGKRVKTGRLNDGDRLRIGDAELVFRAGPRTGA
jgi:hypothetical protein